MKRRNDYKVAMAESMELEPLGGMDKPSDTKRNGINKYGKCYKIFYLKPNRCKVLQTSTEDVELSKHFRISTRTCVVPYRRFLQKRAKQD